MKWPYDVGAWEPVFPAPSAEGFFKGNFGYSRCTSLLQWESENSGKEWKLLCSSYDFKKSNAHEAQHRPISLKSHLITSKWRFLICKTIKYTSVLLQSCLPIPRFLDSHYRANLNSILSFIFISAKILNSVFKIKNHGPELKLII